LTKPLNRPPSLSQSNDVAAYTGKETYTGLTHVSADGTKLIHDVVAQRAGQVVLCMDSFHIEALIVPARPHPQHNPQSRRKSPYRAATSHYPHA
jgi:hypothetical protein